MPSCNVCIILNRQRSNSMGIVFTSKKGNAVHIISDHDILLQRSLFLLFTLFEKFNLSKKTFMCHYKYNEPELECK